MRHQEEKKAQAKSSTEQKDPIQAAAEYGIDIAMLEANLARSPSERIRRHQIALETFNKLRKARRV
jgi:hypothetical protein